MFRIHFRATKTSLYISSKLLAYTGYTHYNHSSLGPYRANPRKASITQIKIFIGMLGKVVFCIRAGRMYLGIATYKAFDMIRNVVLSSISAWWT